MQLKLIRKPSNQYCTIGNFYVDGAWECFVLEDPVRPAKIKGETAIPAGRYRVQLSMSPRFKMVTPILQNVPNYEYIRIHPGNTAADTEGCLLPGQTNPSPYTVGNSGKAFAALMAKLVPANQRGEEIWLTIE